MFEQRREKVLLSLVLGLLAALALDRVVVRPVWRSLSGTSAEIAELSERIDEAERTEQTGGPVRQRAARLRDRLRVASEQGQNEFRRYLEAQVDPPVEVTSVARISAGDVPEAPTLQRITYELQLFGPQDALRKVLANLDASEELLRVEKLDITNASLDDPRMKVKLEVSTIASTVAVPPRGPRSFGPSAGRTPPLLARNMFFPAGRFPLIGPGGIGQQPETGEFVLAGAVASARRRAALLEFPSSGQVRWVGVGERVGLMTLADVTSEGAIFELGEQRLALAVGRPGADLLAGRRVLGGGFELVGVCHGRDQEFAMVQLDAGRKVHRVFVKDRLGSGVVVGISEDAIVLEIAGAHRTVPVGGRLAGESELR